MEIHVKQNEIEAALRQYLTNQGTNLTGRSVFIVFTSGRNPAGLTAAIDIGDVTEQAPVARSSGEVCATAAPVAAQVVPEHLEVPELVADDAHAPLVELEVPAREPEAQAEEAQPETPVSLFS